MYDEIAEQSNALTRCAQSIPHDLYALISIIERFRSGEFTRVVLAGMGGSFAAMQPAALRLIEHGIDAHTIEASELLYYQRTLLTEKTLLVLISQSGKTVEIVRLLDELEGKLPILGVTNSEGSPLAARSSASLYIQAGPEATVATKTYTCTLATLHLLTEALIGGDVEAAAATIKHNAEALRGWLPQFRERVTEAADLIGIPPYITFLGRGYSRGSAMAGALCVKETAKLPTDSMVAGQYRHGPVEVVQPGSIVVMFSAPGPASALHGPLSEYLSGLGVKVIAIGATLPGAFTIEIPLAEPHNALIEMVPVQLLAAELAARQGFEVGKFRYIEKVTTVE